VARTPDAVQVGPSAWSARRALMQEPERLVGVALHVGLAADGVDEGERGIEHERLALGRQRTQALRAEPVGQRAIGVRDEREVEAVLGSEAGLGVDLVTTDADAYGAD